MARTKSTWQRNSRGVPFVCGCYYTHRVDNDLLPVYLPQVKLDVRTTILTTASRCVLKQTFVNQNENETLGEIKYAFPLFDGVSVVDFKCEVEGRTIYGLVKERSEARRTYEAAKSRGEQAALLEQLPEMTDVFTTSVSNIPKGALIHVTITYIQELKHDAEVDGLRLTIPTHIAPRYSSYPGQTINASAMDDSGGISVTVDIRTAEGAPIKKVLSPSHPIELSLGSLSTDSAEETLSLSKASASLALGTTELEKDFVLQVVAKDVGIPQAILETHPSLPGQRALLTTLVPKFNLKSQRPEIIFIADRSGSMAGNIPTLISALNVFLKSIPIGCMFNIVSFGSNFEFLWPKSKLYDQATVNEATRYVSKFGSDFGGTETLKAVKAAIQGRLGGIPTEVMLLTDGDIWGQDELFSYLEEVTGKNDLRIFPIGIGGGVSSSLIEGVARAGKGFAQMVANKESLDNKIVRMLKGALTPHIKDYQLAIKYQDDSVDVVADALDLKLDLRSEDNDQDMTDDSKQTSVDDKPISLYNPKATEEHTKSDDVNKFLVDLPKFNRPRVLQTPTEIPALFPFNRTYVYLLLSPEASNLEPKSVVLKATSPEGPLELDIPIQIRVQSDKMVHQLAAREATQDLEEGRGWINGLRTSTNDLLKDVNPAQFDLLRKREAIRLGVEFQVGGKHCSFVAVEANEQDIEKRREDELERLFNPGKEDRDWEIIDEGVVASAIHADEDSQKRKRSSGAPRHSTGGAAPRKQLASKAARKSAPSPKQPSPSLSGRGNTQSSGRGLGRGGAYRHRMVASTPAPEDLIEPTASTMDLDQDGSEALKPRKAKRRQKANVNSLDVEAEIDAEELSDEDMGFGLFDGDSPPASPAPRPITQSDPLARSRPIKANDGGVIEDVKQSSWDETKLLQELIKRHSFEGAWNNDDVPCDAMGILRHTASVSIEKLIAAHPELNREIIGKAIATAIVVTFLERLMMDREETWELIVEKARSWLDETAEELILQKIWKEAESIVPRT